METVRLAAEAKSIEVRFEVMQSQVSGDPNRLQQMVWNLLSNAVKFTPTGGQVEIWLEQVDSQVQIRVTDTGQGIEPDFLPFVFDYFRQADSTTTRRFAGLGLGLAIVRHIVEMHGGTVRADSPGKGQGATFTVRLPLISTIAEANQSQTQLNGSLDLSGIRVLVVDDEPDTRDLLTFVMEQHGAVVVAAASACEALESLRHSPPDVLVCDIGMPEMNGYTLMRQVRVWSPEQGGQIPAIALTAYAGEMNQKQAFAAGFQMHISKPVEPEAMARAIAALTRLG